MSLNTCQEIGPVACCRSLVRTDDVLIPSSARCQVIPILGAPCSPAVLRATVFHPLLFSEEKRELCVFESFSFSLLEGISNSLCAGV